MRSTTDADDRPKTECRRGGARHAEYRRLFGWADLPRRLRGARLSLFADRLGTCLLCADGRRRRVRLPLRQEHEADRRPARARSLFHQLEAHAAAAGKFSLFPAAVGIGRHLRHGGRRRGGDALSPFPLPRAKQRGRGAAAAGRAARPVRRLFMQRPVFKGIYPQRLFVRAADRRLLFRRLFLLHPYLPR